MATERPIAVCYNGACPLCRREIDLYRRMAAARGVVVDWRDIAVEPTVLAAEGLKADDLARRLHVVDTDGRVVAGVDAFRALWSRLPATRWLARVVGWWPLRPLAGAVYERLLAPVLFAFHKRRQRRAAHTGWDSAAPTVDDAGPTAFVVGAAGFIGRAVVRELEARGYRVTVHARSARQLTRLFPGRRHVAVDLTTIEEPADWRRAVGGAEVVVYAAGIMGERGGDRYKAVHHRGAATLFDACAEAGVPRTILISAAGADAPGTAYAETKLAAERHLEALGRAGRLHDWAILRPSAVCGRGGGSDHLFRALAALPIGVRIAGDPGVLRPVHVDDLAVAVADMARYPAPLRARFDAGGPEEMGVDEIVARYRTHFGLAPQPTIALPFWALRILTTITALLGTPPPLRPEPVAVLAAAPAVDPSALAAVAATPPAPLAAALARHPATGYDIDMAREALLGFLARVSLGIVWLASGLLPLLGLARPDGLSLLAEIGVSGAPATALLYGAATLDVAVGVAVLRNWRPVFTGCVQLLLIGVFTGIVTVWAPAWWLDPLGPIFKNLPIVVLVLIVMARGGR